MKPMTIDLERYRLIELAMLFGLIAASRWAESAVAQERPASFAERELARKAVAARQDGRRARGWQR